MPQLVKKRRSGWALLAAGAMVASLLAVAASPAASQTARRADVADETTRLSACVQPAADEQAFTDVSEGHAFGDAINCVAYYGITNGTGDGTTYSPNQNVTRAQMAVFIARAASVAGVDLGDAMSAGFTDIGDIWQEAQDAINRLGSKGMIPKGGEFRPGDDITRAEMATFLIGLLVKAAMNVSIDSDGDIQLGTGGSTVVADDWFQDARDSVPAANDAEISALFELGVTKGASPAAVQNKTKQPLDYNYEPFGTVNRGAMAEFITRALAHTSVRPEGISVQYDGFDVVVSSRDAGFQPVSNTTVDVFSIDTNDVELAFRGDGSCAEAGRVSDAGSYKCEIDGADPITGGGGDAHVPLDDIATGGTTVWGWTGDKDDTVDDDTDLYRLDIPEDAATKVATRVRISTEYPDNKKVHLGSSVLYTVQLENDKGPVPFGVDKVKPRPAQFLVKLETWAITSGIRNLQGTSVVSTIPLITDADGKATFAVSGLPDSDPDTKGDKYVVEIKIQPAPNGNAPASATDTVGNTGAGNYYVGATTDTAVPTTGVNYHLVDVRVNIPLTDATATDHVDEGLVFSTEKSNRERRTRIRAANEDHDDYEAATTTHTDGPGLTVTVEPAADYVASSERGASTRAKVTVTDQYGDAVVGARVSLASDATHGTTPATPVVIGGGRALAVGRDGSHTFGYTRRNKASYTETLTASWDHDGDTCSADDIANTAFTTWSVYLNNDTDTTNDVTWDHDNDTSTDPVLVTKTCYDMRPVIDLNDDGNIDASDQPGSGDDATARPIADYKGSLVITGTKMVEWADAASAAVGTVGTVGGNTGYQIMAFDKDTNTIFVDPDTDGTDDEDDVLVLYYDSNDRFNIVSGATGSRRVEASSYAGFEKNLSKATGYTLEWGAISAGSRPTNSFELNIPAS